MRTSTSFLAYSEDSKYLIGREDDYPQPFIVKDGKLAYCDGRDFEIAPQPTTDRKHFINEEDVNPDFPPGTLSQMVFVPIEEFRVYRDTVRRNFNPYNNYWEEIEVLEDTTDEDGIGTTTVRKKPHYQQPGVRSVLSVELKSDDADVNIIPSLISFLNSSTIDKEFSMNEEVLRLQAVIDDFHQVLIMQIVRASAVLMIVVLGTTGLFLIFLYRRKKQMAVSIAYGSTKARLFGEIFSEVMLITAVGTALGIFALKHYKMPGALEMYNAATFQPECVIIPVVAAVLCAFLTALLSFAGIGEVSPAKILKDL